MSILFSDPVTAYYIPTAQGTDSLTNDNRLAVQPKSSQNVAQSEFPSMEICGESAHEATRRIIELRYHDSDVKPSVSQQTLEDFVTVQKVETHPVPGVEGMTWCILSCQSPPDQDSQSRYIAALDYAMLEGFDAVVIEPFDLTQRTHQAIEE
ncbi:hypothetical protein Fcan01_26332 [Folsomia candida]|uniref:Uncharacterized protein n=1 Tax=Folsomia candida TaxID=158441 RepID=A0A226D0A3_FOLCA|nr:hypothetical protein Fcan01_26332 [Folsomia candida]